MKKIKPERAIIVDDTPEEAPDPKRQDAARKAWATIRANMPKKLAAQTTQCEKLLAAARKEMARAFNRMQKYEKRLGTLLRRQRSYLEDGK